MNKPCNCKEYSSPHIHAKGEEINKSDIFYEDEDLRIYVKEQDVAGNLFTSLHLVWIGLVGLEDALSHLTPEAANDALTDITQKLTAIAEPYVNSSE